MHTHRNEQHTHIHVVVRQAQTMKVVESFVQNVPARMFVNKVIGLFCLCLIQKYWCDYASVCFLY